MERDLFALFSWYAVIFSIWTSPEDCYVHKEWCVILSLYCILLHDTTLSNAVRLRPIIKSHIY